MNAKGSDTIEQVRLKLQIGGTIKERRKNQSISQEMLAERIGITRQSVARIENGTHFPSIPSLIKITQTLEISTDTILGRTKRQDEL